MARCTWLRAVINKWNEAKLGEKEQQAEAQQTQQADETLTARAWAVWHQLIAPMLPLKPEFRHAVADPSRRYWAFWLNASSDTLLVDMLAQRYQVFPEKSPQEFNGTLLCLTDSWEQQFSLGFVDVELQDVAHLPDDAWKALPVSTSVFTGS